MNSNWQRRFTASAFGAFYQTPNVGADAYIGPKSQWADVGIGPYIRLRRILLWI